MCEKKSNIYPSFLLTSFPGPAQLSITCSKGKLGGAWAAMQSWAGLGNISIVVDSPHVPLEEKPVTMLLAPPPPAGDPLLS